MNKLNICKRTRAWAIKTLGETLKEVLASDIQISEADFRDKWLKKLQGNPEIYPDGWYTPPPYGIGVSFGSEKDTGRLSFKSLRPEENWPKEDVFLDRDGGIVSVYASPVDKKSGIIGDMGLTLYWGKSRKVIEHIKNVYQNIIPQIFDFIEMGMEFSQLHKHALEVFEKNGAVNNWWISRNDPTGINIGHTIPATYEDWSPDEQKVLDSNAPWQEKADVISKKRRFINSVETTKIQKGMALTIEPRPKSAQYPELIDWFHCIAMIDEDGNKELVKGYEELFKIAGMDYL